MRWFFLFGFFVLFFISFVSAFSSLDCLEGSYFVSSDYNAMVFEDVGISLTSCDLFVESEEGIVITNLVLNGIFDVDIDGGFLNLISTRGFSGEDIYFLNGFEINLPVNSEIYFLGDNWVRVFLDENSLLVLDGLVFVAEEESYFDFKKNFIGNNSYLEVILAEGMSIQSSEDYENLIVNNYNLSLSSDSTLKWEEKFLKFNLNSQEECLEETAEQKQLFISDFISDSFMYDLRQNKCNTEIVLKNADYNVYDDYLKITSGFFNNSVSFESGGGFVEDFILNSNDVLLISRGGEGNFEGMLSVQEDDSNREQLVVCGNKINKANTTLGSGTEINFSILNESEGGGCVVNSCFFSENEKSSECTSSVCAIEDRSFKLGCGEEYPIFTVDKAYMDDFYFENGFWGCDSIDCFDTSIYLHSIFGEIGFFSFLESDNVNLQLFEDKIEISTLVGFNSLGFDYDEWEYVLDASGFSIGQVRFMPEGESYISEGSLIVRLNGGVVYDQQRGRGYILKEAEDTEYVFYLSDGGNLQSVDCCMGEDVVVSRDGFFGEGMPIVGCSASALKTGGIFGKENVFVLNSSTDCVLRVEDVTRLRELNRTVGEVEIEEILEKKSPFSTPPLTEVVPSREALVQAIISLDSKAKGDLKCCGDWTSKVYKSLGYSYRYFPHYYSNLDQLAQNYDYPISYNDNRPPEGHALIFLGFGEETQWWVDRLQFSNVDTSRVNRPIGEDEALVISYGGTGYPVVYMEIFSRYEYFSRDGQTVLVKTAHPWHPLCWGDYELENTGKYAGSYYWSEDQSEPSWGKYWEPEGSQFYPYGGDCPMAA
jgi:hypothetical protein